MTTSTTTMTSSASAYGTSAFWERLWLTSGVQSVALSIVAYVIYGHQPQVGATADTLIAFYDGNRVWILVSAFLSGLALLNLLWFAAAIRTTLTEAGRDGWGAAVTASSAVLGGLALLLLAVVTAFAYAIGSGGSPVVATGLHDLVWSLVVMSSFPRAMLIMAGTFGLWRAELISNGLFATGVAVVVLVLLGGSTWLSDGFWAPDGTYSRLVSPALGFAWILVVSRVLLMQPGAARSQW